MILIISIWAIFLCSIKSIRGMNVFLKLQKILLALMFFGIASSFANNCELVNFHGGEHGLIEFKCDEDTSLKKNKVVFYFTGSNVKIDSIKVDEGRVDYDIDNISANLRKVELNVVTETLLTDLDYKAHEDEIVKLRIKAQRDSNLDYKLLWGGVVKNSYKNRKNKNNNLQFYRDKSGNFFAYEKGLACAISDDCDDKVKLSKDCDSQKCQKLSQKMNIYADFGIAHQRLV